eukprot:m.350496 g.350496  ORF g.350496 m.350496 type:complete len:97 (-) comp55901_c0_seq14:146-436(-)
MGRPGPLLFFIHILLCIFVVIFSRGLQSFYLIFFRFLSVCACRISLFTYLLSVRSLFLFLFPCVQDFFKQTPAFVRQVGSDDQFVVVSDIDFSLFP